MKMSPFSAPFSGAPKSEGCCFQNERLLYGREPNDVRAEPGKQKPRSCRTQELARSSAQENEWQKKAGLLNQENRCGPRAETKRAATAGTKKAESRPNIALGCENGSLESIGPVTGSAIPATSLFRR